MMLRTCRLLIVLLVLMLPETPLVATPYVFEASASPYTVNSTFLSANSNLLNSGFTVRNGATVNWEILAVTQHEGAFLGPIAVDTGGTLNISAGGSIDARNDITISGQLNINTELVGQDYNGMIIHPGNTMTVNGSVTIASDCYVGLRNNGSINVNAGATININRESSTQTYAFLYSTGSINVSTNAVINVVNCALVDGIYITAQSTLGVSGTITINNPTGGGLHNDGTTEIIAGGTIFLNNSGGTGFSNNIGLLTINGNLAVSVFSANNGFYNNQGTIVRGSGSTVPSIAVTKTVNNQILPYIIDNRTITTSQIATTSTDYRTGFCVASGVTVAWSAADQVTGTIIIEGTGSITGSITKLGLPYLVANEIISDTSPYRNGFYIAKGVTVTWAPPVISPMNGTLGVEGRLFIQGGGMVNRGTIIVNGILEIASTNTRIFGLYNRGTINIIGDANMQASLTVKTSDPRFIGLFNDLGTIAVGNFATIQLQNTCGTGFYNNGNVIFSGSGLLKIDTSGGIGVYNSRLLDLRFLEIINEEGCGVYNAGGNVFFRDNSYIQNADGVGILNDHRGSMKIPADFTNTFNIQNTGGTGVGIRNGTFIVPVGYPSYSGGGSLEGEVTYHPLQLVIFG